MPFENLLNISIKKDWVDYFSALLTPTIAGFGLYIAFNQKRIEETRIRHELFERRYKQFDAVVKLVESINRFSDMKDEYEAFFLSEATGMKFIFNEEIKNFVDDFIYKQAKRIQNTYHECNENTPNERIAEIKSNRENLIHELIQNLRLFEDKTLEYMQLQQPCCIVNFWRCLKTFYEKINAED